MSIDARQIKQFTLENGASLVGIADAQLMDAAPEGHRATDILSDARAVIVMATPQAKAVLSDAHPTSYMRSIFSCEAKLEVLTHNLANLLDENGFSAIPVPVRMSLMMDYKNLMGDISHKHAAVLAGLGQMGKSSLLITPKYGNRVYVSSVITNAPVEPDMPFKEDLCNDCVKCIEACPVGAISKSNVGIYMGDKYVEKHKCFAYCRTNADVYQTAGGLYTCRICRSVCMYSM